jgi:hypothetical protein
VGYRILTSPLRVGRGIKEEEYGEAFTTVDAVAFWGKVKIAEKSTMGMDKKCVSPRERCEGSFLAPVTTTLEQPVWHAKPLHSPFKKASSRALHPLEEEAAHHIKFRFENAKPAAFLSQPPQTHFKRRHNVAAFTTQHLCITNPSLQPTDWCASSVLL